MASARARVLAAALTAAIGGCSGTSQPDPVSFSLRFQPDSLSLPVGARTSLSMFASRTAGGDVDIRLVEWTVDDQTVVTLDNSRLSIGSPIYATIDVTCVQAGRTSVGGNVTLSLENRLSGKIAVTCTPAP
jgi:hypothetical protein